MSYFIGALFWKAQTNPTLLQLFMLNAHETFLIVFCGVCRCFGWLWPETGVGELHFFGRCYKFERFLPFLLFCVLFAVMPLVWKV